MSKTAEQFSKEVVGSASGFKDEVTKTLKEYAAQEAKPLVEVSQMVIRHWDHGRSVPSILADQATKALTTFKERNK